MKFIPRLLRALSGPINVAPRDLELHTHSIVKVNEIDGSREIDNIWIAPKDVDKLIL